MNQNSKIKLHLKKLTFSARKRRGVAEIIGTMMLMAITVVGATILSYFVNNSFEPGAGVGTNSLDVATSQIKLRAYDARDSNSTTLIPISGILNKFDGKLCGKSCISNPDELPSNNGTEFFVIQFTNNSAKSIFLDNLQLNSVVHKWDSQPAGTGLALPGSYPHDGKFSILKTSTIDQLPTSEIKSGQTVNLLVKLSPAVPDIGYNKGMFILLNIGAPQPVEFLIESGAAI